MHIDIEDEDVRARYDDQDGLWQRLILEKDSDGPILSGDSIYLRAHTGKYIDVETAVARARYDDHGDWQRFVIEKMEGGDIYNGDTIYLRAHTGKYIDVEDDWVKARFDDMGDWQALTVEKLGDFLHRNHILHPSIIIFIKY